METKPLASMPQTFSEKQWGLGWRSRWKSDREAALKIFFPTNELDTKLLQCRPLLGEIKTCSAVYVKGRSLVFLLLKVRRNKELKERVRLCSSLTKLLLSPSQANQLSYVLHITHSYVHPKVSQNAYVFLSHRAEGLLWVPTGYFSLGLPTLPPRPWHWQQQLVCLHQRPKNKTFEEGA